MKKGSVTQLLIESEAFEGKGFGKIDGLSIFVPNTAPGDLVEIQIIKKKKSYAEGRLINILKEGSIRIHPKCSHASVCGGCSWQHLPYSAQLEFKSRHVEDHIRRIAHLPDVPVLPALGSAIDFHYRNKMEFSFGDRKWLTHEEIASGEEIQSEGFFAGMHAPGRFDRILELNECYLMDSIAYEILSFTKNFAIENDIEPFNPVKHTGFLRNIMIRKSAHFPDLMVNLVTYAENEPIIEKWKSELIEKFPSITTVIQNVNDTKSPISVGRYEKVLFGPGYIRDSIGKFHFTINANTFFQTNTIQAEKLYETAKLFADIQPNELVYDLYCGVGTLTLFLSENAQHVVGIELNPISIENAKKNAIENNVTNVSFELGDMKDTFNESLLQRYRKPDCIITDPPRAGMHPDVISQLKELKVSKLVYVSCNSSTMARDLELLKDVYDVIQVQPVDMFPQTYHIESVAQLRLKL